MIIKETQNPLNRGLFIIFLAIIVGALLGSSIVLTSPNIVIIVLVALLSVVMVSKNPVLGIIGFIILTSSLLASESNPGVSIGIGHIYLTDIILLTLFWMIGWRLLRHPEEKLVRTWIDIPLFLFVVVAFVSTGIAMLKGTVTLRESLGPLRDVMGYLIFFAVTNLVRTKAQLRLLRRSIIAIASVVSVVMIIQYALGTTLPFLPGRVETLSTEGERFYSVTRIIPPGYSIVFIAFVTVCAVWFFDKKYSGKLIITIPLALTGAGVLLTFKRHFWGALVVIFLIMVLISNRKEIQKILLRGLAALVFMLLGLFVMLNYTGSTGPDLINSSFDRVLSLFRSDTYENPDSSLRWRDFENEYAMEKFVDQPYIGVGLGSEYRPWVPDRDWSGFDGRAYIHSGFFWLLLRTGGIGFLLMIGIMITVMYRGFKYWRLAPRGAYILGFTLAILGMFIGNWVEPLISEWYWTAITATMMGINELLIREAISSS